MCNCGAKAQAAAARAAQKWEVKYPDGTTAEKSSEVAAKIAASKVDGATYAIKG